MQWQIREPGTGGAPPEEPSWTGAPAPDASSQFDAPEATGEDDRWDDPTTSGGDDARDAADQHVREGRLRDALRIYQDLAVASPEDQELEARVAEIARLLQHQG